MRSMWICSRSAISMLTLGWWMPEQAHPDVPVVERMEDLWRVSKLQRERKARAQAQQTAQVSKPDQAHAPQAPSAAEKGASAAKEDSCAAAAGNGSGAGGTEHGKHVREPDQAQGTAANVQLAQKAPAPEAADCQVELQGPSGAAPAYDDLD